MTRHTPSTRDSGLLLGLAWLLAASFCCASALAQEGWPAADSSDPLAGTTRKIDDYGKVGHCDETARLDNFAIHLQNEAGSKGYLLVYLGKGDLPAWKRAILERAESYLVTTRGLDPARLKVVNAGYREERTTELWIVAGNDPAPEPTNTVEVKHDWTKAYQWDEKHFDVSYTYDSPEGASEESEEGGPATAEPAEPEGDDTAPADGDTPAGAAAGGETAEAEPDPEEEWRKEVEKYEITIEWRGPSEEEAETHEASAPVPEPVLATAAQGAPAGQGDGEEAAAGPQEGTIKVSLWWDAESFAEALRRAPGSRACLIFYHGAKVVNEERVNEIVARALARLEAQFGIKRQDVLTINGGYSPRPSVELWVIPRGAAPPKPKAGKGRGRSGYGPAFAEQ